MIVFPNESILNFLQSRECTIFRGAKKKLTYRTLAIAKAVKWLRGGGRGSQQGIKAASAISLHIVELPGEVPIAFLTRSLLRFYSLCFAGQSAINHKLEGMKLAQTISTLACKQV